MKKRELGQYIPDFIIDYEDGSTKLVELQLNRDPLWVNDAASNGLQEALGQIKDWFGWIMEHEPSRIKNAQGIILIGRRQSYIENKGKIDSLIYGLGFGVTLLTYDDLSDVIRHLISDFEKR